MKSAAQTGEGHKCVARRAEREPGFHQASAGAAAQAPL